MGSLRKTHLLLSAFCMTALVSCDQIDTSAIENFDFDLRNRLSKAENDVPQSLPIDRTTGARPAADSRGVISYDNYQMAQAFEGDTVAIMADRIGVGALDLATFNGRKPTDTLRKGEVLALPKIVAPENSTSALKQKAQEAINKSETAKGSITPPKLPNGEAPIEHRVQRGETAFTIARLYGVSPKALADMNQLDAQFSLKAGQTLYIPLAQSQAPSGVSAPGTGSATPVPPTASTPQPDPLNDLALPDSPNLGSGNTSTAAAPLRLLKPVDGSVLRPYTKAREGIDFAAPAGSPVRAAASGTVAAVTRSTNQVPIMVLKHADNLLTVYANIDGLKVKKGDRVRAGQTIAEVRKGSETFVHFEMRRGFEAVDPTEYLQ